MKNKKVHLNAVRQNGTKKAAGKPKAKPVKTAKTTKKSTAKTTLKKPISKAARSPSKKAVSKNPTTKNTVPEKVLRAEILRMKSVDEHKKLDKVQVEWSKKIDLAKNQTERNKINDRYENRFVKQWDKDSTAYKRYVTYINRNFTKEQTDKAWRASKCSSRPSTGNFMSKTYTNGLLKAVRDEKK